MQSANTISPESGAKYTGQIAWYRAASRNAVSGVPYSSIPIRFSRRYSAKNTRKGRAIRRWPQINGRRAWGSHNRKVAVHMQRRTEIYKHSRALTRITYTGDHAVRCPLARNGRSKFSAIYAKCMHRGARRQRGPHESFLVNTVEICNGREVPLLLPPRRLHYSEFLGGGVRWPFSKSSFKIGARLKILCSRTSK